MAILFGYEFQDEIIITGTNLAGAKIACTRAGCTFVGYISPINNMYIRTHVKATNWHDIDTLKEVSL